MSPPQGLATYPGIQQLLSASITLSHGISPSTATLTFAPQSNLVAEGGTLRFIFGNTKVEFPGCKVDQGSIDRNEQGEVWRVSIFDRRWKWRFGHISGTYNSGRTTAEANADAGSEGETPPSDERTPRQLAALYLDAMEEKGYDVSALPNELRPPVELDYDNPASALAELCDKLACRVVLGLDNKVRIVKIGEGAELPQDFLLQDSPAINPPEKPDNIAVICGPSCYQVDFPLEAVGIETESSAGGTPGDRLKRLDDLSYKPKDGWATADIPFMTSVGMGKEESEANELRALAVKSVFRYYRISVPVKIPGYDEAGGEVKSLDQILPLLEQQVTLEKDSSTAAPARVFGCWFRAVDLLANSTEKLTPPPNDSKEGVDAPNSTYYNGKYTIDAARGLVIFERPVYRNLTTQNAKVSPGPARLVLRAACQVRHAKTSALARYVRNRSTGSNLGTATMYLRHDEIVLSHRPQYDPANYDNLPVNGESDKRRVSKLEKNDSAVNQSCDHYLDSALAEFLHVESRHARTIGIRPIDLDGAICQVTFEIGPGGATTSVARHVETPSSSLNYRERRRMENASRAEARRSQAESREQIRREAAARRRAL